MRKILWVSLLFMFLCVTIYGYVDVVSMMAYLRLHPSIDIYANDVGFQVMVFVVTKGIGLCLLTLLVLLVEYAVLDWMIKRRSLEGSNTFLK